MRALSLRTASWSASNTFLRLAAFSMSMKSITMMPPMLRRRSCCTTCLRRLEVGPEDGLLLVLLADVAAGVDVDRGERLGLVEDQIAAGLEPHAPLEGARDLGLDAVLVEERRDALVEVHARARGAASGSSTNSSTRAWSVGRVDRPAGRRRR